MVFEKYIQVEKEYIPRRCCTDILLKKLRAVGIKTTGYDRDMEPILKDKGFGLPIQEEEYWHFMVNHKYQRYCLNYSDALAEELLFLNQLNLL